MKKLTFELDTEFIRLCDLLKVTGLADSGAQGKHLVADGQVKVDGLPESRKTAKIRAGQVVNCKYTDIVVEGVAIRIAPERPATAGAAKARSEGAVRADPWTASIKPVVAKPAGSRPPARKPAAKKGPRHGA